MMFQCLPAPECDVREFSLMAYAFLITLKLFIAVRLLRMYRANRELNIVGAIGMMFAFLGVGRILGVYFDYYLTAMNTGLYALHFGFYKIAMGVPAIGIGFFLYAAERSVLNGKDRYACLIGYIIVNAIGFSMPEITLLERITPISGVFLGFIPVGYIYLIWKSKGPMRTQTLFILAGFVFYVLGSFIIGEFWVALLMPTFGSPYTVHLFSVGLRVVGILLINQGFSSRSPGLTK